MTLCGQSLHHEPGAEQDRDVFRLVRQVTSEEAREVDQRHCAKVGGLSLPKRL